MPLCPYGAVPKPEAADLQAWVDHNSLPIDFLSELTGKYGSLVSTIGHELLDYNSLCASNPEQPTPLTADDLVQQSLYSGSQGIFGRPAVVEKAWAWIRYGTAVNNCVCKPPPPPTGAQCPFVNYAVSLPSTGVSPAFPYAIPQSAYDHWVFQGGPPPTVYFPVWSMSYTNHSPPTTQRFVEWSSDQVAWHAIAQLGSTATANVACQLATPGIAAPIPPLNGWLRLHNNSVNSLTLAGFNFCFCELSSSPAPLPPQPPLTSVPTEPTLTCSTDDLCAMVNDLAKRLGNLSAQVSDLQAILGGTDQFAVLEQHPITGEGEINIALGTRAVSLEVTKLSDTAFTSALGRPRGLMRVGSIRFGDGIGYSPRQFIDGDKYDTTRPAGALSVSWQLLPSAEATLKFLR